MNIWKILHIKATTDKKAIKKAYALRSKTIHPEEKPEEFSQLYEAYKMALQYAKHGEGIEEVEIEEPVSFSALYHEVSVIEEPQAPSELTIFFAEQQKYREACMKDFQKALKRMYESQGLNGEAQVWQSYLKTKEFKEIQMDSKVIRQMADAVQNMGFHVYEFSLNLWEVYDLQEDEVFQYHGALGQLCKSLAPAKSRERAGLNQIEKFKKEELKKKRYFQSVFVIMAFLLITGVSVVIYQRVFMSRTSLNRYMSKEYPDTEFSKPERQNSSEENWDVFSFYTLDQPEITVRARVKKGYYSGTVIEDYREQRLRKIEEIVEPYGLNFYLTYFQGSENGLCVFTYSDIGEIEEFCRLFNQFYEAEKNNIRRYINWIGFCPEDIQHPQILLEGGVTEELFHTPVFELSDLPEQDELLEFLQNSWIQYMYFYEAWNLTPEQQKKYGPGYLEIARSQRPKEERNADETFEPSEAAEDVRAIEAAYGLYLPLETSLYNKSIINYYMTIGNAYQYLKAKGVETEIYPDGSGFSIYSGGRRFPLGNDLRISLQTIYIWTK